MEIDLRLAGQINEIIGKKVVEERDDVNLFEPLPGMRCALEIRVEGKRRKRVILKRDTFERLQPIMTFKPKVHQQEPWDPFDSDYASDN